MAGEQWPLKFSFLALALGLTHPHSGQDLSVAIKKKKWGVCDDHASPPHTILQPTTGMLESGDVRAPYLYARGTSALSPSPSPQP